MLGRGKKKVKFHKADCRDSGKALQNPGCGWYHVYTFFADPKKLSQARQEGFYLAVGSEDERLALLLIDIGAFREQEISEDVLEYIENILAFFQKNDKQMILRFAYDTKGSGMENEPQTLSLIKQHMKQLGKIIRRYAADILVLQGIFVGNWGEMHGSRFLYRNAMVELFHTLYRETEGSCFLAVRTPAQYRTILADGATDAQTAEKLTLFNDGIFGSATDLGTYGTERRQDTAALHPWSREDELSWQNEALKGKPAGGETVLGESSTGYETAAGELKAMHVSYLNSVYDADQLNIWKKEQVKGSGCWQGLSGYEYIERHLGYRFVVCDVQLTKKLRLEITIRNDGFAELCDEAECCLILENDDKTISGLPIDTDARVWESGIRTMLTVDLSEVQELKPGRLSLQLKRRRDGAAIRFANNLADERVMLGELK